MSAMAFREAYGPYALVVGGSDGLGLAFAEAIARRGVNLVLIARQQERLLAAADRLRSAFQIDVIPITADMAQYDEVETLIDAVPEQIGLLVYNVAFAPIGLFQEQTREQLALAADVNVRAPLLLVRHLVTPMIQRGRGGIVLMSSLLGAQGCTNFATYGATKSFGATLAEALWSELKPHNVDVLACVAGAILTPDQRAGQSKPVPGSLRPDTVAELTLSALGKSPVVTPGGVNKVWHFMLSRMLSKRAAIKIMSKNTANMA